MNVLLKYSLLFFILLIVQVFILNGLNFLGYATPFIYIYFILKLPVGTNKNLVILLSFLLGLGIDIFCNTPGIIAAPSVLIAFLRPFLIKALTTLDVGENREPSISLFGLGPFLRYVGILIVIHHSFLLSLEYFSLSLFNSMLLIRIVSCSVLTFVLIWVIEAITGHSHQKK